MDFTFLFIVILMVFAAQSGLIAVAAGLFLLLLFTAKGKMVMAAAFIGGALVVAIWMGLANDVVLIGGLFVIFLLLTRADAGPAAVGYGGAYG